MGFFSDIIHDSQRQVTMPTSESPKPPAGHEASPVFSNKETGAADRIYRHEMMPDLQVWEENDRPSAKASMMTRPKGPAVRQVMGLSLLDNVSVEESPSSDRELSNLSHCGKHKLTGVKSARTVPSDQDSGQTSVFSDSSDTSDCFHTATSDAQVKESLSPVQAQGTGKMPMETRRRRSAGSNTSAGSVTPPSFFPDCNVKGQRGESAFEAKVTFPDKQESVESERSFKDHGVDTENNLNRVSQASRDGADSLTEQSEPQENNSEKDKLKYRVGVLGTEVSSLWPKESGTTLDSSDQSSEKSGESRITIEMLEVTVVSSEQRPVQIQGRGKVSSDFTSRLYLRNI